MKIIIVICSFLVNCGKNNQKDFSLNYIQSDTTIIKNYQLNVKYLPDEIILELTNIYEDKTERQVLKLISKDGQYYIKDNNLIYDNLDFLSNVPFLRLEETYAYKLDYYIADSIKYDSYVYKIDKDLYAKVISIYPLPSFYFKVIYDHNFKVIRIESKSGFQKYQFISNEYKGNLNTLNYKNANNEFLLKIKKDSIVYANKYRKKEL
jgi:hypothetical protein